MTKIKGVKTYLTVALGKLLRPMFLIFLLIAAALWYLSMLTHTYMTTIRIPMSIKNSFASEIMIVEQPYELSLRIEGEGYKLLKYKIFPSRNKLIINTSQLKYENTANQDEYVKQVSMVSLFETVMPELEYVKLLAVNNNSIEVITSAAISKRVPVVSDIVAVPSPQFKQIGETFVDPDSVWIRGIAPVLDTIMSVKTERRILKNLNHNVNGTISLVEIPGAMPAINEVKYRIRIDNYTETSIELPVEVRGYKGALKPIVMPVKAVLKIYVNSGNFHKLDNYKLGLFIDIEDKESNLSNRFKVRHSGLPAGCTEVAITPSYVDVVFEKQTKL